MSSNSKKKYDVYFPNIDKLTNNLKYKSRYDSMQAIDKTIKILIKKGRLN